MNDRVVPQARTWRSTSRSGRKADSRRPKVAICCLLVAPLIAVAACSPAVSEPPKGSTPPPASATANAPTGSAIATKPDYKLVKALVPDSDFKPDEGVVYSGDGLVITHKNKALYWEQNGKSGLMFRSPKLKKPLPEIGYPWDGDLIEEPVQVSKNWVLFRTQFPPEAGGRWKLWIWDRRNPTAEAKRIADNEKEGDGCLGVFEVLRGDWAVWEYTPSEGKTHLVAYDLTKNTSRVIKSGPIGGVQFVDDNTIIWRARVGTDQYNYTGLNLKTGSPYAIPKQVTDANPTNGMYATDGQTWYWSSSPTVDDQEMGGEDKLMVWHPSINEAYSVSTSPEAEYVDPHATPKCGLVTFTGDTDEGGQTTRVVNVATKTVYEVWQGQADGAFMGDQFVLTRNAGTKDDAKIVTASIPISKFGPLTCSGDELR